MPDHCLECGIMLSPRIRFQDTMRCCACIYASRNKVAMSCNGCHVRTVNVHEDTNPLSMDILCSECKLRYYHDPVFHAVIVSKRIIQQTQNLDRLIGDVHNA